MIMITFNIKCFNIQAIEIKSNEIKNKAYLFIFFLAQISKI